MAWYVITSLTVDIAANQLSGNQIEMLSFASDARCPEPTACGCETSHIIHLSGAVPMIPSGHIFKTAFSSVNLERDGNNHREH